MVISDGPQHGFGIAVYGDYLYWTDWMLHAVMRANKYSGIDITELRKNIPKKPMAIVVVAKDVDTCMYHTEEFNSVS